MEHESHEAESTPIFCANNCGFFGSAATNNLCSKCYKDVFLSKAKASIEAVAAAIESDKLGGEKPSGGNDDGEAVEADASEGDPSSGAAPAKKPPNRCSSCNKKVGLMGFKCRCGDLFCSLHRYSDKHGCPFDYKGEGQDAIAKANPIVKPHKVDKI